MTMEAGVGNQLLAAPTKLKGRSKKNAYRHMNIFTYINKVIYMYIFTFANVHIHTHHANVHIYTHHLHIQIHL